MPLRPLPNDHVDVWWTRPDTLSDEDWRTCENLLAPGERERHRKFRVDGARQQFLAARGMLRTCHSAYLDRRPADWAFAVNAYGRPHVEGRYAGEIHFNLSHTAGFVTCAIARSYDIGVDVERTDRDVDHLQLAPSVFAPMELEQLGVFQ